MGASKALLEMTPEQITEEVKKSGLRGRGGAGFPTGMKWEFARKSTGEVKYVLCNADEGDPGAFMDRSVLEADPHAVDASSNEALERASSYLIDQLAINGKWKDLSTVGTGHPGLIYMNYPAYPYSFPLIALSRFLNRQ